MKQYTDWEGKTWLTGNHRWTPIFPKDSMEKCIQCGRIESIQKRNYGGLSKCLRLKQPTPSLLTIDNEGA